MFHIYKLGVDSFSMFSQNYFSLLTYSDPPEELMKLIMDLFLLEGEKAIHAIIVKMLEENKETIIQCRDIEEIQQYLKYDIFKEFSQKFEKDREKATSIEEIGLSFYKNI